MTTIAWDGTALCGDRSYTLGELMLDGPPKIARTPDGRLIGAAGSAVGCRTMMEWLADPKRDHAELPDCLDDEEMAVNVLEIMPDGEIRHYEPHGYFVVKHAFMAIGSGAHLAIAAMHCGKTSIEAMRVAAVFDPGTGGEFDRLELSRPMPAKPAADAVKPRIANARSRR